jgi:hypothetical protein
MPAIDWAGMENLRNMENIEKRFDYSQNHTYFRRKKIDATDSIVASGAKSSWSAAGANRSSAVREWRESPQHGQRVA